MSGYISVVSIYASVSVPVWGMYLYLWNEALSDCSRVCVQLKIACQQRQESFIQKKYQKSIAIYTEIYKAKYTKVYTTIYTKIYQHKYNLYSMLSLVIRRLLRRG